MNSTTEIRKELNEIKAMLDELTRASTLGGYISENALAKITGYSYQTFWRLRKEGKLRAKSLGRARFYKVDEIVNAFEDQPLESPPGKQKGPGTTPGQ